MKAQKLQMALWAVCGLLCALLGGAAALGAEQLREGDGVRRYVPLGLLMLAGIPWGGALALAWVCKAKSGRKTLIWLWAMALLLRLPAYVASPRHSDDVYRYLWDGAVQKAGKNPYVAPPDGSFYQEVRTLHAPIWERINHRHLPTVYPPAAQVVFRISAVLAPATEEGLLSMWKSIALLIDLSILWILGRLLQGAGGVGPRWLALWAWSPVCAIELCQNAHMDGLGILGLLGALLVFDKTRAPALGLGALSAFAVLVKPLGAAALPSIWLALKDGRRRKHLVLGAALVLAVIFAPYLGAGSKIFGSLGEYSRRWRGNDGVYSVVLAAAKACIEPLYGDFAVQDQPWRYRRLAQVITGRDRDAVYLDELTGFVARMVTLGLFAGWFVWVLRRSLAPAQAAYLLLLGYLLLSPVLHPWYVVWVLALCPLWPALCPPGVALALLVPLGYLPLPEYLAGQPWVEPLWTRIVIHGTTWGLLLWCLVRLRFLAKERSAP